MVEYANEYEPDPVADGVELGLAEEYYDHNYSSIIQNMFKRKHRHPTFSDYDDNDEVVESRFLDWEEEEEQSEVAGMREDKEELMREKKRKLLKQKRLQGVH
jgi:SPT2 chromatin protein